MTATLPELAAAARVVRDAMKDKSYRSTPLGLMAGRYLRWKRFEWGATTATLRDYEIPLSYLALDYADLELRDFEPPVGTERLREFLEHRWGERSPRTRSKNLSILRDFFRWCVREGEMIGDPTVAIRSPRKRAPEREIFSASLGGVIVDRNPRDRDRVALLMLFRLGVRKGELRGFRFEHYDAERQAVKVLGKGGKWRTIPVEDSELRAALDAYVASHKPEPHEYLLYPERTGAVKWSDRRKPMSDTAAHRWWHACLDRAGVKHLPMHSARHTAITDIVRDTGNLKAAQVFAGHASIQTTADIYAHFDLEDLREALQIVAAKRAERRADEAE